jgi:sirohydrochlorin cobaltochelatase
LPEPHRAPILPLAKSRARKEKRGLQALIIIGHGSHLNADSSAPVYRHAEAIRRTGAFDEVRECFWKEEPSMREVFDLVEAEEVYVVPLFISEGYFTREVIPRDMGLDGPAPSTTRKLGKTIHYTPPVGTHPLMPGMILRRAEEIAGLSDEQARGAGLVIIGHGTERNSNSSEVIYRVSREADAAGVFGHVRTGFLDQQPEVGKIVDEMEERTLVLVPFFVAEGWHTQETIPDDLGLNRPAVSPVTEKDGRTVFYAAPVGTFPEVAEIVLQRAREAGARVPEHVRVGDPAHV